MNEAILILEELEKASGTKEKKDILKKNQDHIELYQVLRLALSFFVKFHIKKIDVNAFSQNNEDKFDDFLVIAALLEDRKVTGNEAKNLVENFLSQCNLIQQKWFTRILQKDLRIGISVDTVNLCGFDIPNFDVMLATNGKKSKKMEGIVKQGGFLSPKMDGYRCLTVWDGKEVHMYSRNGASFDNFPQIKEALLNSLVDSVPVVLDGEIMSNSFQDMQKSAFASVRGPTVGDVQYHIFGAIKYGEWISCNFKDTTSQRLELLTQVFDAHLGQNHGFIQVEQLYVDNLQTILDKEGEFLAMGFEGAMFLPANEPYYKGRRANKLMKFKTFCSMECEVVSFQPGERGSKYENTLGAITVLQEDGKALCGVGSGFKDEERNFIWNNQVEVLNRIAEIKYQDLTAGDKVMRFPVFVRWRDQGQNSGKI